MNPVTRSKSDEFLSAQAFTIAQFCASHQISRTHLYSLDKCGKGPRRMLVGRRVLISVEAAADWRARMELTGSDARKESASAFNR